MAEILSPTGTSLPNGRSSPVSAAEVDATRRPVERAATLPPRVYHDPAILAYEQEAWFVPAWLCVGREEDAPETGSYVLISIAGESLIVVRGNDGKLRAFFNVCRHRGATLIGEHEPCGRLVRFQCPYHAWIYDLEGRLRTPRHTEPLIDFDPDDYGLVPAALETWQGFVFVNLDGQAKPLGAHFGDMTEFFARFDLAALRRGEQIDYDVKANWKAIVENYSECYHCPGVHPQLNQITPYNLGAWLPSRGPWNGSYMEVVGDYETLSLDGATHGRPEVPGFTAEDRKRVYYFVVWPHLLISLHPDYLMTHRVWPLAPDRTRVVCEWFFHPEAVADPSFDPSDAVGFWDLTNRQDWEVCEMQQRGTASRAYIAGRYSAIESGVHAFDLMVADRYANDGVLNAFDRLAKQPWTTATRESRTAKQSGNGAVVEVPER
jgi:Rieske 2Fe-2S family protein